jgi:hypothetical protein
MDHAARGSNPEARLCTNSRPSSSSRDRLNGRCRGSW